MLKTFMCAEALIDADVCVVFIADFASVGSMNEDRLRNIVHVHSETLSLPWDSCTIVCYPETPRGHFVQHSPSEKHEAADEVARNDHRAEESDADVLVDH